MDEYIEENIENIKFEALTPKILDKNNPIYTKALDFAFDDDSIKNIAITGVYGSGKSTIWNTYVKEKNLKNIITVSLGKYEDECVKFKYNNDGKVENISCSPEVDNDKENRIERQIINQIVSQIDSKKISKSKYKFKSDKADLIETICIFFFLSSIFILINWNKFKNFKLEISVFNVLNLVLFVSLFFIILVLKKKNIFSISKINFKLIEAQLDDKISSDETVIDKDMKEIVYLLYNSGTEVVVFEDLDRYDNIEIYNKLRELNFLFNRYVNSNEKKSKRIIKFIYMVKDGLFVSKDRTKFYDFIMPVVPIVDSRTSENYLVSLLIKDKEKYNENTNELQGNILANISLYIDDMRLLKNIVNEYYIYLNILPMKELELNKNKLFAMIVLKNVFPEEFELLQKNRGNIYNLFNKLEEQKKSIRNNIRRELIKAHSQDENTFRVKEKGKEKEEKKAWKEHCENEIKRLLHELNTMHNYDYAQIIKLTNEKKIKQLFKNIRNIKNEHDINLIKYLLEEGLIDKTYYYYIGNFNFNIGGLLKKNDIIYMKGLLEGKELDLFLDVETPKEIVNRLRTIDYDRPNILNKNILKYLIDNKYKLQIRIILLAIVEYKKSVDFNLLLDEFDDKSLKKLIKIMLEDSKCGIFIYIFADFYEESKTYRDILKIMFTDKKIENSKLFELRGEFIERLEMRNKLINLSNNMISEQILLYILENDNISLNTKIKLIITKIENNSDVEELKKYISKVSEIERIASVFDNKYPSINDSEREIAKALIKYGYIKERAGGRIMLIKRKNKDLDSGYVNDEI